MEILNEVFSKMDKKFAEIIDDMLKAAPPPFFFLRHYNLPIKLKAKPARS